jgi:predicted signal transduction protein with EAL and GGDEF domain
MYKLELHFAQGRAMSTFNASWWLMMFRPAVVTLMVAGSFLLSVSLFTHQPTVQALSVDSSVIGPPAFFTLQDDAANYALEYPAAWSVDFDEGWLTTLYPTSNVTNTQSASVTAPSKIEIIPVVGATTLGRLFDEVQQESPEIRDVQSRMIDGVPALQLDILTFTGEPARLVLVVFGEQGLRLMAYGDGDVLAPILDTLRPARQELPNTRRI